MRRRLLQAAAGLWAATAGVAAALYAVPLPEARLHPKEAYRFFDRDHELVGVLISDDGFFRMHVRYESLPPVVIQTLLHQEDRHYYAHLGVNPLATARAAFANLAARRVVSGGSTITMQLARMLERRDRTLGAKLIEAFRAVQLEMRYTKNELLAFYLSLAPYGGNLEGIEAASFFYFGIAPRQLSLGQAALLTAIPRAPNRLRPDRYPERARAARDGVLRSLLAGKVISADQFRRAAGEPIPRGRRRITNLIPHTAWRLRRVDPARYVWNTTLDRNLQARVETMLANYVTSFQHFHITNAAAVVLDNRSNEARAIVGSTGYFDSEALGANDGSRAPRSPGSTLKPFLYGLALDAGLISEKTVLYDIPINYGGYAPENYAKNFIGPVAARDALTESLNVVAVRLSNELGMKKLYELLKNGGISTLDRPVEYYGLPLVLGGVNVPLVELTNLYAALAHGGVYMPYRITDAVNAPPRRLLSPEAAWIITHILTDVERPDFPASWQFAKNRPTVAWKTGTSYANQDAWSVGYTPEYTIGVWIGNFDGTPSKGLVGHDAAAPMLFDLFQAVDTRQSTWFKRPEKVKLRKICPVSGRLPTRFCKKPIEEYYIEGKDGPVTREPCAIHQEVTHRKGKRTVTGVYEIWPPEMAVFLMRHGVPIGDVPPYDPANMAGQTYYPPKILSPAANTVYYQRLDKVSAEQHVIKLSGGATNRVRKVYWFLNDALVGQGEPTEEFFINPPPGNYTVKLLDDVGGLDQVKLKVRDYRELTADR